MFLAVDIGNTNIKIGLFSNKRILRSWRLATDKSVGVIQYQKLLKRIFRKNKIKTSNFIDEIVICSVVPSLTAIFKKALHSLFKKKPLILGRDIIAPIKNRYKKPEQVGQDRLANALAVWKKYGGPAIVVDFGTAITFDVISAKGSYLGGVIAPGIEVALKALVKNADLLPEIRLSRPKLLLGRDTAASMQSGIVYGYSCLVEGILQQLQQKLNFQAFIVATGGCAGLISPYCRSIQKIDANLTLEGIRRSSPKR